GKAQRILLVGLGKSDEVTRSSIRRAAGVAAKRARSLGATQFAFAIAPEARNGVAPTDLGQVIVEGAGQGAWAFTELKAAPEDPKPEVEAVAVVCDAKEATQVAAGQKIGEGVAAGHQLARYLDQAGAEHGGHEVGYVRRGRGARYIRGARPAETQTQRDGRDPVHRKPAVGHGGEARRRRQEPLR